MEKRDITWGSFSSYRNEIYGISIISIMIFHFSENVVQADLHGSIRLLFGLYYDWVRSIGVEIFLFLSGMGIWFSLSGHYEGYLSFLQKRVNRLLLPYFLVGIPLWFLKDLVISASGWKQFLMDLSFLSFFLQGKKTLWFILLIFLLYLISPPLFQILTFKKDLAIPVGRVLFLLLLIVEISFCVWLQNVHPVFFKRTEIALLRIPAYLSGMYCGKWIQETKAFHFSFFILCMSGILLHYISLSNDSPFFRLGNLFYGLFFLFVMVGLLSLTEGIHNASGAPRGSQALFSFTKGIHPLQSVGGFSLELYMIHVSLRSLLIQMGYHTYLWYNYLFCILLSIPLSLLLHRITTRLTLHLTRKTSS